MNSVDLFSWRLESWENFDHDLFADSANPYGGLLAEMQRDHRSNRFQYEELLETVRPHFSSSDDSSSRIPSPSEIFSPLFPASRDPSGLPMSTSGEWGVNITAHGPFHAPPPTPTERSWRDIPKRDRHDIRSGGNDKGQSLALVAL